MRGSCLCSCYVRSGKNVFGINARLVAVSWLYWFGKNGNAAILRRLADSVSRELIAIAVEDQVENHRSSRSQDFLCPRILRLRAPLAKIEVTSAFSFLRI